MAAPQGLHVVSGSARCDGCQIHATEPSVLHWDSYSIAADEHIHYPTPHATLNRVKGESVSHIDGRLSSNGPLWLINPNGIIIGERGQINAASFLASTLDVLDGHTFKGDRGSIVQKGVIECPGGYVVLMGAEEVVQEGKISAEKVAIGAGQEIEFSPDLFRISSGFGRAAIQCRGLIEAKRLEKRGGEVYLVAEGLCEVTDAEIRASAVHVSAEKVGVLGGTAVAAQNISVESERLFVGKEASFNADGVGNCDGGKVILLGHELAKFYGNISIRGGEDGGDGGFAEVSGKLVEHWGKVDGRAPRGKSGTFLLDPSNITIGTMDMGGSFSACPATYTPAVGMANEIAAATLNALLDTCSVTIDTTSADTENGDITISEPISWSMDNTLTLIATRSILINNSISSSFMTGFQAMDFTAGAAGLSGTYRGITIPAGVAVTSVGGHITMSGSGNGTNDLSIGVLVEGIGGTISTQDGDINITGDSVLHHRPGIVIRTSGSIVATGSGTITLHGTGGSNAGSDQAGILFGSGGFVETNSGLLKLTGIATNSGAGPFRAVGIRMGAVNAVRSTSGHIELTGNASACTATFIKGVRIDQSQTITTTGQVRFIDCVGGGTSATTACDGVDFEANFSVAGDLIITNSRSGIGGGHGVDINTGVTVQSTGGGDISMEGTSFSQAANVGNGINIVGTLSTTGAGNITLAGTATASSTGASRGALVSGSVTTNGTGAIRIAGQTPATSGVCIGVLLSNTNSVTNTGGGDIYVSGVSQSSGTSSHGVSWTSSWTTSTTGTVTFGDSITAGTTTIEGCQGGSGLTSHGINAGATFTTAGNVIATNMIFGGTGSGSAGFVSDSNFSSTGSNQTISITASSLATAGAAHGISLTANTLRTTGGGAITLIGTGGASNTASHGINISGGAVSTITGSGNISLTGTASGSAVSFGIRMATSSGVTSTNGAIALNGTSNAAGSNSHGISITSNWTTGTSGALSLTGAAMNGFPINLGAAILTSSGDITFNSAVGLGISPTVTSGANLEFVGTVNATTAGAQSLILNATNGMITIGQNIGGSARLNAFQVISDGITFDANVTAISVDLDAAITVTGARILTATGS